MLTDVCHCTGPLHTAPSFSGGTVQTGLTMDATELQRARSGLAGSSSGQLQGDLPPSKLQRHGSATHASSIEQVNALPMQCPTTGQLSPLPDECTVYRCQALLDM